MSHDHGHGAHHDIAATAATTLSPSTTTHHHVHHETGAPHSDDGAGHHMVMYFHGGCTEIVLFNCWRIESYTGLIFSSLLVFFMSAAYEGIKWFRVYYQMCCAARRETRAHHRHQVTLSEVDQGIEDVLIQNASTPAMTTSAAVGRNNVTGPVVVGTLSNDQVYVPTVSPGVYKTDSKMDAVCHSFHQRMRVWAFMSSEYFRIVEAFLYGLQLVLAYFLMLIAMTYNVYLFAAVVVGAIFGHWLFAGLKCVLTPSPLLSHVANADRADNFASDACH